MLFSAVSFNHANRCEKHDGIVEITVEVTKVLRLHLELELRNIIAGLLEDKRKLFILF